MEPERKTIKQFTEYLRTFKSIGLDTMCFIYQFADDPVYSPLTNTIFFLLEKQTIKAVTSIITVIEIFALPEKKLISLS